MPSEKGPYFSFPSCLQAPGHDTMCIRRCSMMTMNIEDACLGGNEVGEAPGSLLDGGLRAFKHALQPGAVGGRRCC